MSDLPPVCAAPDPNPRPPAFDLPDNACDCHFHIFDGPSVQVPERSYSGPPAPLDVYRRLQSTMGLSRSVIVQPSIYGTDNRTTLETCQSDPSMKAVVVIDEDASDAELSTYAEKGAVGCRVNMLFASNARINGLERICHRIADLGWHLQLLADISSLHEIIPGFADLPVPVDFDHFGHIAATKGINDPGFIAMLRLLGEGRAWVKLSGAYRLGATDDGHGEAVNRLATALVAANPDNLVWGSDWPHPAIGGPMPNDGDVMDDLARWAPDPALRERILVKNPSRLYGFDD